MKTKELHSFKLIASQGGRVIFDERLDAESPREAREKMKEKLGLESLTGIVYSITEIPMDVLREIVARYVAEITLPAKGGDQLDLPSLIEKSVTQIAGARIHSLEQRLAALESGQRPKASKAAVERFDALNHAVESSPEEGAAVPSEEEVTTPNILKFTAPAEIPAEESDTAPEVAITGTDWGAVRSEYERTRSLKQTAAKFDVPVNTLKARVRRGGWGK